MRERERENEREKERKKERKRKKESKLVVGCRSGSSGREPASQILGSEFKPQCHQKKRII
jgi:hypothetical protein